MIRTIIVAIASLCIGIALSVFYFSPSLTPPEQEEPVLTALQVRDVLKHLPITVPAGVFATGSRVIPAENLGEKNVELLSGTNDASAILLLRIHLSFEIKTDDPSDIMVVMDKKRDVVTITIPSPHFIGMVGAPAEEVAFILSPPPEEQIRSLRADASLSIQREANSTRYVEAAKQICASHLKSLARAWGYTAEIVWSEPGTHSRSRSPL